MLKVSTCSLTRNVHSLLRSCPQRSLPQRYFASAGHIQKCFISSAFAPPESSSTSISKGQAWQDHYFCSVSVHSGACRHSLTGDIQKAHQYQVCALYPTTPISGSAHTIVCDILLSSAMFFFRLPGTEEFCPRYLLRVIIPEFTSRRELLLPPFAI